MSRSGFAPWEDDLAADWLIDTISESRLPQMIERMLSSPVNKASSSGIRSAAGILILLGNPFIWPIADLRRCQELAASQLEKCLMTETQEDFRSIIQLEIDVLKLMASNASNSEITPKLCELLNKWYR